MRRLGVLIGVAAAMLVTAAPAAAVPAVSVRCTPEPADCSGWFRSDVSLTWTVEPAAATTTGCQDETFTSDTTGAVRSCTAEDDTGPATVEVTIRRDATPPDVTAAVPARPPDHAGWYSAPIGFDFLATDAVSGLASCAPASYAGPDGSAASVLGVCQDIAGNVSQRAFGLMFDATAPPISELRAVAGDGSVAVRWTTNADAASVEVLRIPGVGTALASLVFSGPGSSFEDHDVVNGVAYVYRVRLTDAAGNARTGTVKAMPAMPTADPRPGAGALIPPGAAPETGPRAARLRFPRANAVISARRPPRLRWMRVRRARYYNVQLYRGVRKVLSAWPARPRYQIERRWSFAGKRRRLTPGRYRWYVWPGYGRPSKADYGDLLGRRAFRVVR